MYLRSSHLRSSHSALTKTKNYNFFYSIKILNLSLKKLKLIAKNRNTNGCESMPKEKLLRIIDNNKNDRKSLFKLKNEETKKSL